MRIAAIYKLACLAYSQILRGMLVKAIDDPEQEWDDIVLKSIDNLFGYSESA